MRRIAVCLIVFSWAASPAFAQTLFRCGNTYQDRPCEKGVEQRISTGGGRAESGVANAPSRSTLSSPFGPACARRGEQAQHITWKREGGATLERQINDAGGQRDMIELIQQVYARRGSAPEIRASVEAECVAEKQKEADTAAALSALQRAAPAVPQPTAPATSETDTAPAAAPARNRVVPAACAGWQEQRTWIESQLRAGGNLATMERLQQQRRDVERRISDAGCPR